ncbi:Hypothetical protein RM25_1595 [Propionibacterium freudenreichii subsp. freudenreichii]|nr:Hypothetical protein RM25_1595 [Propionibacterium freudenreichii subsp. freudenreichii]
MNPVFRCTYVPERGGVPVQRLSYGYWDAGPGGWNNIWFGNLG